MTKRYKVLGILPLEFPDGQQAETGEEFDRDFEATTGVEHETWLIQLGHIAEVVAPAQVTKTPIRPTVAVRED